jgi:1-acyl-sn-glycerol-3-phosphate acyltransferase
MITSLAAIFIRLFTGATLISRTPRGPKIFYACHRSHFDTLVIWAALPPAERKRLRPLAALDYWGKSPLRRWFSVKVLNCILLERDGVTRAKGHPLQQIFDALESGDSILIFPEGTRTEGDTVAPFKPGLFHLARKKPEVSLIPIHLENLARILPKGELLPLPLIARISIKAPICLAKGELKPGFLNRAREALL